MIFGEMILERLGKRVVEYLGNDLQLNIQNIGQIESVTEILFSNQTACITLSNHQNATLSISTSYKLSELILRNFINIDIFNDDICEFSQTSLEETLNITLGNIIKDLPEEFGNISISPPFSLENQQIIHQKDSSLIYTLKITIENEIMLVSYFI